MHRIGALNFEESLVKIANPLVSERTPGSPIPNKTDVLNEERHLVRIPNPNRGRSKLGKTQESPRYTRHHPQTSDTVDGDIANEKGETENVVPYITHRLEAIT